MRVRVINTWDRHTAIWLYSRSLCKVDNKDISIYDEYSARTGINKLKRKLQMEMDSYFGGLFLKNNLKNYTYDIMHYADPMVPPIINNKTQIVTIHDNPRIFLSTDLFFDYSLFSISIKKLWNRNMDKYKKFENVLTNSNYVRKSLLEYGFIGNIETVYLPIAPFFKKLQNRNEIRKELELPDNKILLLSVSSNAKRKNLNLIEKAMEILPDNFALVRVGTPIGNSTTFQNVSNEKLNKIYNACDVLLMPSIEEGLGLPVVEGFTTGIPVVASDIEVFHEIGGDAVEYIDPMDVQSLIAGIKNAIENKDDMIIKGDKIALQFSFEIFKEKMLDYYRRLL